MWTVRWRGIVKFWKENYLHLLDCSSLRLLFSHNKMTFWWDWVFSSLYKAGSTRADGRITFDLEGSKDFCKEYFVSLFKEKKTYNFEILHLEWILELTVPFFHCIYQCSLFTKDIEKFYIRNILETAYLRNGCSFGSCDRNILVCDISQSEYLWIWSPLCRIMSWLIIYVMWVLSDVSSFNYFTFCFIAWNI